MKKYTALLLLLTASTCFANKRDWKPAMVIGISENDVSGPLIRESHTMHYTVETEEMVLLLDYSFHPSSGKHGSVPGLPVSFVSKIAVEGKHAYILDNTGAEVKMRIVKKTMK